MKKLAIVLAVGVVAFFVNNDVILPDIMESRNIVTAREMLSEGNWLVPTMNGVLRLEKPPLPTWIASIVEWVAPNNIALQRCAAGLAAMILLLYFYRFAERVLKIDPLTASLIFLTCYNVILMGRTATWDIYCHAFMMGGIYHFARAVSGGVSRHWLHFAVAGAYMGLSFMSKGPVALYALFLPFLICCFCFFRLSIKGRGWGVGLMIALFAVVGFWWYVYVHIACSERFTEAALGEANNWVNYSVKPWYYYWKFFLESGAWSLLLLTAIIFPIFDRGARKNKNYLFALAWLLCSVVLLSLMPEKKNRYLFPILIPAAYLTGVLIVLWKQRFDNGTYCKSDKYAFRINAIALAVVVSSIPIVARIVLYSKGYIALWQLIIICVICSLLTICLLAAAKRLKPLEMAGGVVVLFLFAESFGFPALRNIINNPDIKSISKVAEIEELRNIPFYHKGDDELRIEIVYAAGRKILPIDIKDTAALRSKLPCALVTHEKVEDLLSADFRNTLNVRFIDCFNDNHRPKGNRLYREWFIYNVTLLEKK